MPEQTVTIEPRGAALVGTITCSHLDEEHTARLQSEIASAAAAEPQKPVLLDFAQVEFMPSLSLGALVTMLHDLKQRGQSLMLAGLRRELRETLAVTRLDRLFEICEDVDEALTRLKTRS